MRLNFSHATYEEATLRITNLRKAQGLHKTAFGSVFSCTSKRQRAACTTQPKNGRQAAESAS